MKILIVYATSDGQTRKIARFCADRLADAGHAVELLLASDSDGMDLGRFGSVILAGSLHVGNFQKDLVDFAKRHAAALSKQRTLFLPVSLAAAGNDPKDWAGLRDCVQKFVSETGWNPEKIEHVAGAFRFTEYDFFRSWAMRMIAAQKGEEVDPNADKEYTDWVALGQMLDAWMAAA